MHANSLLGNDDEDDAEDEDAVSRLGPRQEVRLRKIGLKINCR